MRSEMAVFVLFLAGSAILRAAPREETTRAEEPRYDLATEISLLGTITEVREVPANSSLSGIHLIVKSQAQVLRCTPGSREVHPTIRNSIRQG